MSQIKQIMMANIDILYVHLIETFEEQRVNFFAAMGALRSQGYDVPKIAPFLDPFGIWAVHGLRPDVSTPEGKDEFVRHYLRFYYQYLSVNPDSFAETYLAHIDGRLVLATWWVQYILKNEQSLTREDVEGRLAAALGSSFAAFRRGIYAVTTALVDPDLPFSDERVVLFSGYSYCLQSVHNDIRVYHIQAGYWDQNCRRPGYCMPRDGGKPYKGAWNYVLYQCAPVHRIYVESWNEYDEGSGIYAADPAGPLLGRPDLKARDVWSDSNDPYEYIRTTAAGAAVFNKRDSYASRVLFHSFPSSISAGDMAYVVVVVQNRGNAAWMPSDEVCCCLRSGSGVTTDRTRISVQEAANEIDPVGGVFRGAPVHFGFSIRASGNKGLCEIVWSMTLRGSPFGEELRIVIDVV